MERRSEDQRRFCGVCGSGAVRATTDGLCRRCHVALVSWAARSVRPCVLDAYCCDCRELTRSDDALFFEGRFYCPRCRESAHASIFRAIRAERAGASRPASWLVAASLALVALVLSWVVPR